MSKLLPYETIVKSRLKYCGLLFAIAAACISILTQSNQNSIDEILAGKEGAIASYDTQYSKVEITNRNENGEMVRYMLISAEAVTHIPSIVSAITPRLRSMWLRSMNRSRN